MEEVKIVLKVIVGLSLLNVWLLNYNKPSRWRGADAKTMIEEFDAYGLSSSLCYIVGFLKVGFALVLLTSIKYPILEILATSVNLEILAASILGALLSGSILMHIKIKDAAIKSLPATLFLIFCLLIIVL